MNTKLHGIDAWNEDVARQDAKQSGKLTKQEIEQRLLALGAQQVAMPSLRRYVAYQLNSMRQDQYILVGRNGALRTGSVARLAWHWKQKLSSSYLKIA